MIGFAIVSLYYMIDPITKAVDWRPFLATVAGIVLAIVLDKVTEYFTLSLPSPDGSGRRFVAFCECFCLFVGHKFKMSDDGKVLLCARRLSPPQRTQYGRRRGKILVWKVLQGLK